MSKVRWVKLGDYISPRNERNSDLRYGVELIEGVNSDGEFQPTKAITDGIDLKPYKAVWQGDIVYNPSRLNIGSLAYRESGMCIVSHLYQVFHVKEEFQNEVLPEFLLIWFKRDEFSRIVDYYNYGSQRAEFNLKKLGELMIPLPSLSEQQKVVNNHGVGSTDHFFVIILVVSKYVCIFAIVKQYSLENIWPESYERKAEQASIK